MTARERTLLPLLADLCPMHAVLDAQGHVVQAGPTFAKLFGAQPPLGMRFLDLIELSGVLADGDYYYVRSRVREYGMFRPQVIERRVLAISFNDDDTIANIEEFGLEDGQVVPIARRVTDTSVVSNGFIRQLLSNIGNINPASAFE